MDILQKTLGFWDNLTQNQKNVLTQNVISVTYKSGEIVYNGDNECIGILIVKSGELRTYLLSQDGKEITLYRLCAGDICILSASCLLKNITFDVHIECEHESEVLLLNASIFSKLQNENVYVENFALKTAVGKFSDVMWAMEQILFTSFDHRLASFLFDESNKTNSLTIKLTHEQIAKYIGSAREVVSRMLKHFELDGLVSLSRGGLTILDKEKLRKMI